MAQLFSTCTDHRKQCRKPYFCSQNTKKLQCTPAFPRKSTMLKFNRCDLCRQHFIRKGTCTPQYIATIEKQMCMEYTALVATCQTILKSKVKSLNIYTLHQEKYSPSPSYEPSMPLNTSNPKLRVFYEDHHTDPRPCLSSSSASHHSNKCHYNGTVKTPDPTHLLPNYGVISHVYQVSTELPRRHCYANPSFHDELSKELIPRQEKHLQWIFF